MVTRRTLCSGAVLSQEMLIDWPLLSSFPFSPKVQCHCFFSHRYTSYLPSHLWWCFLADVHVFLLNVSLILGNLFSISSGCLWCCGTEFLTKNSDQGKPVYECSPVRADFGNDHLQILRYTSEGAQGQAMGIVSGSCHVSNLKYLLVTFNSLTRDLND